MSSEQQTSSDSPSRTELSPELLQRASDEFDRWCQERHARGAQEYGETNFLKVDTLEMAMEEVADLANYARYTFIKLWLLQEFSRGDQEEVSTGVVEDAGFVSTKEAWKNG